MMEIKTLNFISKPANIYLLKKFSKDERYIEEETVAITKTISLQQQDWKNFINNFFKEQEFLKNTCSFIEEKNVFTAVRVTNGIINLIVQTSGYDYARYVAFE